MSQTFRIRRGLDIKLFGEAGKVMTEGRSDYYALKPTDFHGIFPKMLVQEGDPVMVGSPVFFDKNNEQVIFTSPVSGVVTEVKRGEKRVIEEIRITKSGKEQRVEFGKADPVKLTRDQIVSVLLKSGLWPVIRQRPYAIIARPHDNPRSIYISGFDTAPLAPDCNFMVQGKENEFQTGLNALFTLTTGKVYLTLKGGTENATLFTNARGVELLYFNGPHPAGNVGVQIHHHQPINKGEVVWYVNAQDVIAIGALFLKGYYDASRVVALTGSEVINPFYIKVLRGASIQELVTGNHKEGPVRYISGNVLTGKHINRNGYLGFYDHQITIIPEGKYHEFFGWALPGFHKYSLSRTFFSWLTPQKRYRLDTNLHGATRSIVMTGQFERVFPMDIYPLHLLKAILAKDIDKMEALGIYEVDEEDFALCEFMDTSKMEIQAIVREGIEYIRKEMS